MNASGNTPPINFALGGLPPDTPRWGSDFEKALKEDFNRTLTVMGFLTCLPVESNNITLDPDVKDAWGLPAMRVTYKDHPDDMKNKQFFTERMMELMEAAGPIKKWADPVREERAMGHTMGGCRMGTDPKKSVVNQFQQSHDVKNLFVVDGSTHVSAANQNPTWTIMALCWRSCDYLADQFRKGEI